MCLAALAGQGRAAAQFCGTSGDIVCCGDVDGDGIVTQTDLDIATAEFEAGCSGCCLGDVNFDGAVTQADIDIIEAELVENNGQPCHGFRPVPLFAWDPNCYGDPNCTAGCQASLGCLPIRPTTGALSSVVGVADDGAGVWRVDWTVNSALSNINLADLFDPNDQETWGRPITVYRDGRVRLKTANGMETIDPDDPNAARLHTLGGLLRLPQASAGGGPSCPSLPCLTSGSILAGARFTKSSLGVDPNGVPLRVREIIVDGQLDQDTYGCDYNVVVLDVTDPNNPVTIGALKAYTFPGNNRTFIPVPPDPNDPNAFVIPADQSVTRTYDVRVRLTSYRANPLTELSGLQTPLGVVVTGGLQTVASSSNDICTKAMSLQFSPGGSYTSPVKIRLSRKEN